MSQAAPARTARTQAEQAFDELENLLVTLQLPPGATVQEKQLSEATGFGRTPVREAVQRLASLGLLRVFPRKGLVVAAVDPGELAQLLEVRRGL